MADIPAHLKAKIHILEYQVSIKKAVLLAIQYLYLKDEHLTMADIGDDFVVCLSMRQMVMLESFFDETQYCFLVKHQESLPQWAKDEANSNSSS